MATQWILGKVSDAIKPTVQSACASAGSFAGGAMNTVGSSINGVGESINTSIRYYGDGAKDYGNAVMDWAGSPGGRAQTASNPLGLSGTTADGKSKATSPSVYRASAKEKKEKHKAVVANPTANPTQQQKKKVMATGPTKPGTTSTVQVPGKPKPTPKISPTKKISPLKSSSPSPAVRIATTPAAKGVTVGGAKPKAQVQPVGKVKAGAVGGGGAKNNPASNPLGLSF